MEYFCCQNKSDSNSVCFLNRKVSDQSESISSLSWKMDTNSIADPPAYRPSELALENQQLSKSKTDFTIATGVLAGLLGLMLISFIAYTVYKK